MPLNNWPPVKWLWAEYRKNAAWYSGNHDDMLLYTTGFWESDEAQKIHVPIAGDLASIAASLLFSGSPVIKHKEKATNDRLQTIQQKCGLFQKLLVAAELQSVFGGVYLKWNWNKPRVDYPLLSVVPSDAGIARYLGGLLDSCVFWSVVRSDNDAMSPYTTLWRTEETYTSNGRIETKLFKGTFRDIGSEMPLNSIPETAGMKPSVNSGTGKLLAVYVPARLPNRQRPYEVYGRSDFDGLWDLFSALDEAYSSMLRDIRLGKTQIIVPADYLRKRDVMFKAWDTVNADAGADANPRVMRWTFSKADEAYVAMDIDPDSPGGGSKAITTFQPEIRTSSHQEAIADIVRQIFSLAGYSPQSAGIDIDGEAESGTALNVRERKSLQTVETKKTYWWHALMDLISAGLALDKAIYGGNISLDGELTVEFADNSQPDLQTIAEVLEKLERAGAVSVQTKVQMLHPDWDEDKVNEEVVRIFEEKGIAMIGEPNPNEGDLETDLNNDDPNNEDPTEEEE